MYVVEQPLWNRQLKEIKLVFTSFILFKIVNCVSDDRTESYWLKLSERGSIGGFASPTTFPLPRH